MEACSCRSVYVCRLWLVGRRCSLPRRGLPRGGKQPVDEQAINLCVGVNQ